MAERRCPSCGQPVQPGAETCPSCAHRFSPEAAPAAPKRNRGLWMLLGGILLHLTGRALAYAARAGITSLLLAGAIFFPTLVGRGFILAGILFLVFDRLRK